METYVDVFDFIQKTHPMQPLTLEKLNKIGFVVTSVEDLIPNFSGDDPEEKRYLGTGPTLQDGTQFRLFDFRFSTKDPVGTFLYIGIVTNTCITYKDFSKMYPTHGSYIEGRPAESVRWVQEGGTRISVAFPLEKPSCMQSFTIDTFPQDP
jgi:hypothetical protein